MVADPSAHGGHRRCSLRRCCVRRRGPHHHAQLIVMRPDDLKRHTILAMTVAFGMMAHQVASKAARDGFFLTRYPATDLPRMVIVAALVSVLIALGFPRLLRKGGPGMVIPLAFAASGLAHFAEWLGQGAAPN